MRRALVALGAIGLATAVSALSGPLTHVSAASSSTLACELQGSLTPEQPLGGSYSYTFSGTLSNCQAPGAGAPLGGTVVVSSPAFNGCVAGQGSATFAISWSSGDSSTIPVTFAYAGSVLVGSGSVAAGYDQGYAATVAGSVAPCLPNGVATPRAVSALFALSPPA